MSSPSACTRIRPRIASLAGGAALALLLAHAPAAAAADLIEGVAAVVDSEVILLSEVEVNARTALERLQARDPSTPLGPEIVAQVQAEALRNLIDEKVVKKYAQRVELAATPQEVDATIADIAAAESVSPDEVYAAAASQGLSREQYREELGNNITQAKVMSGAIRPRVRVSAEDVQRVFDERYRDSRPGLRARVRQILIPWPAAGSTTTRAEARAFAEQLRLRASESGADFAGLARQYSGAPSAADGGLTTLRQGEVTPEIARYVFEPELGTITPLIENEAGLSFFRIEERFDPAQVQLADVQDALRAELVERQMQPEFAKWLAEQRNQYYIKVSSPSR